MGRFSRTLRKQLGGLTVLALGTACGAGPADQRPEAGGPVEDVGSLSQQVQTTYKVRVHVYTVESGFAPWMMTNAIAAANSIWQASGIQFEFDPAKDVSNPNLPNCSDATVGAYGDQNPGTIAVFYCPSRGGSASSGGPNSVAWAGDSSPMFAHELGHYFGLVHVFREGWVPEDQDLASGYQSVESCIRAKLQNQVLPVGCPNLATGAAIRDYLLDGDGLADTAITLQVHPSRIPDPCAPNMYVPLVVHFTNGTTQDFGFYPARDNVLGYYTSCASPPLGLSPTQITNARNALLTGNRKHLLMGAGWSAWESLGTGMTNNPSVVARPNRLDVVVRRTDGAVYNKVFQNGSWWPSQTGWGSTGAGSTTGSPSMGVRAGGQLDVVTRGSDNSVYIKVWEPSSGAWSGWFAVGGGASVSDSPQVGERPGYIDVVVKGSDGNAYNSAWTAAGGWSGWFGLGPSGPNTPTLMERSDGKIDLFKRSSTSGPAANKSWSAGSWWPSQTGWSSPDLGGTLGSAPQVVSKDANRIDVIARFTNGTIQNKVWTTSGGWWPTQSTWSSIGGTMSGTPSITSWGTGRLDVVARGTDGQIRYKYWTTAGGWSPSQSDWGTLTSTFAAAGDPIVVSWGTGRVDVFVRANDGTLWHRARSY